MSQEVHSAPKFLLETDVTVIVGLASWCVAFEPYIERLEETPPTRRIAPFGEGESLGYGAETTRPLGLGDEARAVSSVPGGSVETAVLQVERANSR